MGVVFDMYGSILWSNHKGKILILAFYFSEPVPGTGFDEKKSWNI